MKLARVTERGSSTAGRFALVEDDGLRLLPVGTAFEDALDPLGCGEAAGEKVSADGWELLAPVPSPASLRDSVGFFDHIRNTRRSRGELAPLAPVWDERPGFYFANPRSLRSATDAIEVPAGSQAFDFELEIAVVLGTGGRDLTAAQAADAIAGYVLFCDWSARDIQAQERIMQIGLGKGKDAAVSLGPWILSADEARAIRHPSGLDLAVSAHVNGELVTDPAARYEGMDWSFEEIVAYASVGVELSPGDVIAAGTVPTGCLLERSADPDFRGWLRSGDEVRISAGPLGEISAEILPGVPLVNWRRD